MVQTINQAYRKEYLHKKNRSFLLKLSIWFAVILGVAGGVTYLLFFSGTFYVKEVAVSNKSFITNDEIRSAVDRYLSEKTFYVPRFKNIFLVQTDKVESLLAQSFPQLNKVLVDKKFFHLLEVAVDQKEAVGIWCFKKQNSCYYFDRQGTAFDTAADSAGALLLNVEDQTGQVEKLGQPAAKQDLLNFIYETNTELDKLKVDISKFIIPADEFFQLNIKTVEGWQIYLSTTEDVKKQINSLSVFLANKISPEKRAQLQYIDLRIPNRVYYK